MKRLIACILALSMLVGGYGALADSDTVGFSVWIPKGEDSVYYASYDQNPVMQYLESIEWSTGRKVDFEFFVPISGEEKNNFNTYLSTGEYCDMMNIAYCDSSVEELYKESIALDLTEYVEEYMPNYLAWLDAHPEYKHQAQTYVDGEWKYLKLCSMADNPSDPFEGFLYRRDWIVEYGECPEYVWDADSEQVKTTGRPLYPSYAQAYAQDDWTGWKAHDCEAFAADYGDDPDNTYTDNVIFPSGGTDPVYISDWEWMLSIFADALYDLGIDDGYAFALCGLGYVGTGDLISSFGGGTAEWYRSREGNAGFGATGDNMRAYIECMSEWYDRGWLDTGFDQHATDMFYAVNTSVTHMGKVGMWQGRQAEAAGGMDSGTEYTKGIMAFPARLPINDLYGGEEQKMKAPDSLYAFSRINSSHIITSSTDSDDLPTLLEMLDWMYTLEGSLVGSGLNAEQLGQIPDPSLYERFGISNAFESVIESDGSHMLVYCPQLKEDIYLRNACINNRWFGYGYGFVLDRGESKVLKHAISEWSAYENTGFIMTVAVSQMTAEESAVYNKTYNYLTTFLSVNIPKFVKGQLDVTDDGDWEKFCKSVNKYRPDNVTEIYARIISLVYGD